jgi:anionic cell wall polymer biosynthesis LytR-Cps2A-Psr (LCP) family protein
MNNKTKLILTAIGLAAIIVPAVLLYFLTSTKPDAGSAVMNSGNRQINKANIEKEVNNGKPVQPVVSPSLAPTLKPTSLPTPKASPVTTIIESTPSSH